MKQKILTVLGIVMVTWGAIFGVNAVPVSAAECKTNFLGFNAWYNGVVDGNCNVQAPQGGTADGLVVFVWKIILNVLVDLFLAVGYIAVVMIIVGGFFFITSSGDPGKAAKGKKTLTAAVIGLVICLLANVIIRTILSVLGAYSG